MSAEAPRRRRTDLGLKQVSGHAMDRDEAAGEEQSPDVQAGGLREERKVLRGEGPLPNHLILDPCDPG